MTNNNNYIYQSLDQNYINKLLVRYDMQLADILWSLVENGAGADQLLDCNACISEIHTNLLSELLGKLKSYNIHDNTISHIQDDILRNSFIDCYCSRLECNVVYEMYEDYFTEHHPKDLEEIKKVFDFDDC